ncbi:MAG: ABC transporter substrate-binding protein [Chloroflexota bacterium]
MQTRIIFSTLLIFVLLLATACGGAAPTLSTAEGAGGEESAASGGGTIIVGTETDIEGGDPIMAGALATIRVLRNVYDSLVEFELGGIELEPSLAESWEISEDATQYTFKLREGIFFHDGEPFNAEAVEFAFRRAFDPEFEYYNEANSVGFFLVGLTEVEVLDEYSIRFTLTEPNAAFLEFLGYGAGRIVSPKAIRENGNEWIVENPVGTGPFKFVEWEKGQKVVLERNPDYWKEGEPAAEQLIFVPIPEPTARVTALLTNQVNMIVVVPPDAVEEIEGNSDFVYEQGPGNHYWFIVLNTKEGPFADKLVRQAVNYAVDKEGLAQSILQGSAKVATQPMPAANWSFSDEIAGYPYDPEKAKELLAEAGYPDGFKTNMIIPVSGSGMMIPVQMNEYIQGNLLDVGIEVEMQSYEWVSYLGIWAQGLDAETTMNNQSIMSSEPYVLNFLLHGDFAAPNGWNTGHYDNPDVSALLDEALRTPDREERAAIYAEAQAMIVEDAPWIFVVNDLQPMAYHKSIQGYVTNPAYVINFNPISVAE